MKKFVVVIFILVTTFAKAQLTAGLPLVDGKVFYQNIGVVPDKNKDFIFAAAKKWMLDTFKDKTGGLTSDDKDQGRILGRCGLQFLNKGNLFNPAHYWTYIFNVVIDCKDNKYRIQLYNMFYGENINDKNLLSLEDYNDDLKISKSNIVLENGYTLDAQLKAVLASLADAMNKAVKDDF